VLIRPAQCRYFGPTPKGIDTRTCFEFKVLKFGYSLAKMRKMHFLNWSFSAKSPRTSVSLVERDLQLKASYAS